jgi:hypothetical protein
MFSISAGDESLAQAPAAGNFKAEGNKPVSKPQFHYQPPKAPDWG